MKRINGRQVILGLAPVAAAVLIAGCGQHKSDQAAVQASSDQSVATGQAPTAAVAVTNPTPEVTDAGSQATSPNAALPPEIDASAGQDMVRPGEIVEITAEGSADVVRMTLQDRLGQKEPMVFDSTDKIWHGSYRVPLKSVERIALSVTAENAANHWRRVWVFVKTQADSANVPADSSSAQ